MRGNWVNANNVAVSNLSSLADLGQIINTLEQLLTDIQSLPIPALFLDLELTVGYNLAALTWSNHTNKILDFINTTLSRIIAHHSPNLVLPDPPDILHLLPHLLSQDLLHKLSMSSIETVMDTVSLMVMSHTTDLAMCREYLSLCDNMQTYILDLRKTLLVNSELTETEVIKVNIVHPSNTGKTASNSCTPVLRKIVEIETNDIREKCSMNQSKDHQFFEILFTVAVHLKQGNKIMLGSSIDTMVANSSVFTQPQLVTRLGKLLRGEFLLEEGRVQAALSSFSEVIQQEADNVRAYHGVAKCFERLGRFQNELEIWNIITSIIHKQRGNTFGGSSLDFLDILIRKLFPFKQMGLVESLVIWAKKCFRMSEYQDSAEKFLDAIALISAGDSIPEGIDIDLVKQEAVLALLIIGNVQEALLVCLDLATARKVGGKRKKHDGQRNQVVLKFLLAKCHFLKGDYEASLQYFDQSLRSCLADLPEDKKGKLVKCEDLDQEDTVNDLLMKMVRIRSRLYYEKSLVYKDMNDLKAFKASIKSAIKLDPNENFANFYLDFLETQDDKSEAENLKSSMNKFPNPSRGNAEDDVVLQFIMDSSTISVMCQDSDMEM